MWVFFQNGFVSIVKDQQSSRARLLVRARARSDLMAFCRLTGDPMLSIEETPKNDYRFRTRLTPAQVNRALKKIVEGIDYPNFKSRVASAQGIERAHVYSDVWAAALPIDEHYRGSRVKPGGRRP